MTPLIYKLQIYLEQYFNGNPKIMLSTLEMNYVFVFLLMSFQMCLNVKNNIEEDEEIIPVMDKTDSRTNSKSNEKISSRKYYNTKNEDNTRDKTDFVDYANDSDYAVDDDTCRRSSYLRIALFKLAEEKQDVGSEEDCYDCIPGLLKGEIFANSEFDQFFNEKKRSQNDLAIKTQNKRENKITEYKSVDSQQNEPPVLLNRLERDSISSNAKAISKVEDLKYKIPYLRVINGKPAKPGDVPYQVSFKSLSSSLRNEFESFCGGVIIGPTKLLSAAHCFEDGKRRNLCQRTGVRNTSKKKLDTTQVVAGNLLNRAKYNEGGQWRTLNSMYFPLRYRFPVNDISVGYVTKPFEFNAHVNMVPYETTFVDHDEDCVVSGYGKIGEYLVSNKLLVADLTLLSAARCSKLHKRKMDKFICTESVPADIDKGDSGGPLVCSGTLVGIVSGHRLKYGSFFTRVSSYSEFIAQGKATTLTHNHLVNFVYVLFVIFTI